jgi:hypothetical protein
MKYLLLRAAVESFSGILIQDKLENDHILVCFNANII